MSAASAMSAVSAGSPSLKQDAATLDRHLAALAGPLTPYRVPGYPGHALAANYIEAAAARIGLQPAAPNNTFRHPLTLPGPRDIERQSLTLHLPTGDVELNAGEDFSPLGLSDSGAVDRAPVTFAGYSITVADDGYRTYGPTELFAAVDDDRPPVALILTHEPLDEDGLSYYHDEPGEWTYLCQLAGKVAATQRRNAAAALLVTTPGADDDTAQDPVPFNSHQPGNQRLEGFPSLSISQAAADQLIAAALDNTGLLSLREDADLEGGLVPLPGVAVSLETTLTERQLDAPILYARLPGVGPLAREHVLVIAGYDTPVARHREPLRPARTRNDDPLLRAGPGADAVASQAAAALFAAEALSNRPAETSRRSILFAFLSDTARANPRSVRELTGRPPASFGRIAYAVTIGPCARPADEATLMGTGYARGLDRLIEPAIDAAPIVISTDLDLPVSRLHQALTDRRVPTLHLTTEADPIHGTPDDTTSTIDVREAAKVARTLATLIQTLAETPDRARYTDSRGGPERPPARPTVGLRPRDPGFLEDPGVYIADVFADGPADRAGLQRGDRITHWNGAPVESVAEYAQYLVTHHPGDDVELTIDRDGEPITAELTLDRGG
ncbi:MAG: PDZ domain-containing protein [Planctomycetota bacterium]